MGRERLVWEVARIAHPIRAAAASVSSYIGARIGPSSPPQWPRPTSAHGALYMRPFAPGLKLARRETRDTKKHRQCRINSRTADT